MVLALSRGGFDPKEHQFVRQLVDVYREYRNAHTRMALISTDNQAEHHTFVLEPGLKIFKVYNGYWYWAV